MWKNISLQKGKRLGKNGRMWAALALASVALAGCGQLPWQSTVGLPQFEHVDTADLPVDKVAASMVDELKQTYPPAKTELALAGTTGRYRTALESALRQAGFGIRHDGVVIGYLVDRMGKDRWRSSLQTRDWRLDRVFEVSGGVVRQVGGSILRETEGLNSKIASANRYAGGV